MMCMNKGVFPAVDRPGYLPGYRVLGTLFKTSFRTLRLQPRDKRCLFTTYKSKFLVWRQYCTETEGHCNYLNEGLILITGRQPTCSYRQYAYVWGLWLEPKEENCSIRTFINCCWALLTDVDYIVMKIRHHSWRGLLAQVVDWLSSNPVLGWGPPKPKPSDGLRVSVV